MLVLSRYRNQVVVITTEAGERIEVTVAEIRGDKVRLGFTADKAIAVHRLEVQKAIEAERKAS